MNSVSSPGTLSPFALMLILPPLLLCLRQCVGIRNDLAACLIATDCVQKEGKTGQECLRDHMDELPQDCQHLYKSYVACRRGMVSVERTDGRKRRLTKARGENSWT